VLYNVWHCIVLYEIHILTSTLTRHGWLWLCTKYELFHRESHTIDYWLYYYNCIVCISTWDMSSLAVTETYHKLFAFSMDSCTTNNHNWLCSPMNVNTTEFLQTICHKLCRIHHRRQTIKSTAVHSLITEQGQWWWDAAAATANQTHSTVTMPQHCIARFPLDYANEIDDCVREHSTATSDTVHGHMRHSMVQ